MQLTNRRKLAWVGVAVLTAAAAAAITALILVISAQDAGDQPSTTGTPTASASDTSPGSTLSDEELAELAEDLTSGDLEVLAGALGLDPEDVPPEVQTGFESLQVEFDKARAVGDRELWVVPARLTQADGSVSEWAVTVVRTDSGLVFVDSAPNERSGQ